MQHQQPVDLELVEDGDGRTEHKCVVLAQHREHVVDDDVGAEVDCRHLWRGALLVCAYLGVYVQELAEAIVECREQLRLMRNVVLLVLFEVAPVRVEAAVMHCVAVHPTCCVLVSLVRGHM